MDTRTAFSDSNESTITCIKLTHSFSHDNTLHDVFSMKRLSENIESIFSSSSPDFDYFSDAKIVAGDGRVVAVHRCILAARSAFFKSILCEKVSDPEVKLELKELAKEYDLSYEALITVLAYIYSGKVRHLPKGVCICADEECDHVACRPVIDFVVEVLYASFVFQISELFALCQSHLLDIVDKAAADDILVVLYVTNMCRNACEKLFARCMQIVVNSNVDIVTLDKVLPEHIKKQIMDSRIEQGLIDPESNNCPDKHVKRIHRALDSDDVELLRMLLKEGNTSLDDACALHYAVAYCDAKTTTELLDLGLADVNHTNSRGYTVLHVAATRRDPKIIVSLLTKGARPSDLTLDGRKALQICKRLTRALDYHTTDKGIDFPKDRLCIEILEQAESRDPLLGEASVSLAMAGDDLRMKLLYLENRVGLAKLLFPMEAKVAMDIAQVEGTYEFPSAGMISKIMSDAQRTTVDLNDAPFKLKEEHLNRLRALSKTVELGRRFFPRCSEVLDKIMDNDDLSQLAYLRNDSPDERETKKQRYTEIQELLNEAFSEDKEEFHRSNNLSSNLSSSASSTSQGLKQPNGSPPVNR